MKSVVLGVLVLLLGLVAGCAPAREPGPTPPTDSTRQQGRHSVLTLKPQAGDARADAMFDTDGVKLLQARLRVAGIEGASVSRVPSGDFEIGFPGVVDENLAARLAQPAKLRVNRVLAMGLTSDNFTCEEGGNLPPIGAKEPPSIGKDPAGEVGYCLQEPAEITEREVQSAVADLVSGKSVVTLKFNPEGAARLAKLTSEIAKAGPGRGSFAIRVDDVVVAAPSVQQAITEGVAVIAGAFTAQTAGELAAVINYAAVGGSFEHSLQTVES